MPSGPSSPVSPRRRPRAAHTYRGFDTMRFTTETLPSLAASAGVDIEINGDPADYREASDTLTIGVSTAEIPGDNDWFELGRHDHGRGQ